MLHIKLDKVEKMQVAYIELTGPYENWGRGLMELKALLDESKIEIVGPPIGLYYNNPLQTQPEKLRSEACLPVSGNVTAMWTFKVKELSATEVATTLHEGPPELYTDTYSALFEWIIANGYEYYGPAPEIFQEASANLRPGEGLVIQQPTKKE